MSSQEHTYDLKVYNGRVKVYIDGYVLFSFSQTDFKGYYGYDNDLNLYGISIYLTGTVMELKFEQKEIWLSILSILDEKL